MNEIQSRNWLTKEEAAAFIGNNTEYYLEQWKNHPDTFFKGWNWAAAIFRVEWMAYRKMYSEAAITLLAVIALGFGIDFLLALAGLNMPDSASRLVIQVLIGAVANGLYRKKAIRTLRRTAGMDDNQHIEYLSKKGGTSILGLMIFLIMEVSFIIVPPMIIHYFFY